MSFDYRNTRLALAGGLLAVIVGALGGGCTVETTEGTEFPFPTEASFCDALAEVQCNDAVVSACYGSDQASLAEDAKSCLSAASRGESCNPLGLTYHPETAESCLLKQRDAYADAEISSSELKTLTEACIAVFSGGGRNGAECTADTDCNTGAGQRCLVKKGEEGKCFKPVVVSAGHKCTAEDALCEDGFFCDGSNCIAQPEVGEACEAGQPCVSGAYCAADKCEAQVSNGHDCTSATECKGGFCLQDSDGTDGLCASTSKLQLNGANCNPFR